MYSLYKRGPGVLPQKIFRKSRMQEKPSTTFLGFISRNYVV